MKVVMQPRKRKERKSYPLNQSLLYKVGSKERLAQVLRIDVQTLLRLEASSDNYIIFELEKETNPFSLKTRKQRTVQQPKHLLRQVHERILALLQFVQIPDYVHACVKGRSYRSNASAHVDSSVVATYDISSFYPSTSDRAVYEFFYAGLKCAPDVAGVLKSLCCFQGGLPTGSPLSPLLSFFSAKPMFDELSDLALKNELVFTCYVDDLTFSGVNVPARFERVVELVLRKYKYRLAPGKSKVYGHGKPKHVTGVVILNGKLSVPHKRFVTVRRIVDALEGRADKNGLTEEQLFAKLLGCLNEASSVDRSFEKLAKLARSNYSKFRLALQA